MDGEELAGTLDAMRGEGFSALLHSLPVVLFAQDHEGRFLFVSGRVETMLGYSPDEWASDPGIRSGAIHPEDLERVERSREEALRERQPFKAEYRLTTRDHRELWVRERSDPAGLELRTGTLADVTDERSLIVRLEQTEHQFRTLVEHIPAMFYIDPPAESQNTVYVSPQVRDILGIDPETWLEQPTFWNDHLHPEDKAQAESDLSLFLETGEPEQSEYRVIRPDGRVVWIHDLSMMVRDADGTPLMVQGAMFDITEQKQAQERLAYMAQHDGLTGLPNRPMFEELLDLALARARRSDLAVAVLYLDLDNFKLVNDSLGHAAGDELLRQVSMRLRDATRDTDLVARQGGDEFLILLADIESDAKLPGPDMDNALLTAESVVTRIQQGLATPFLLSGTEVFATVSIGISLFPAFASDARSLLRQADAAMYGSKKRGPDGYSVYSADSTDALSQLSFTTRLRKAVDSRAWKLHYQPIVELVSGRMIGVEALLRWEDPNVGFVPPGEFIPLAEEMGLIEAIGDWVMEELFRQASEWSAKGVHLEELSFNVSPRQLWQPNLATKILAMLEDHRVDPRRIVVEITEGTAMTDPERTQHILWELHGRGLRLAIDDFGTGYSSLSRLKHMPVSTLKIDRAFVMDVPDDPDAGSMVSAIVGLADSLEMESLAEGIETAEQRRFLMERGCRLGQGYFFSRPVPASEIEAIHEKGDLTRMVDDTAP
jgi:diguanylate cyclase (GGDEF)-like protein/PAS domain S-box-containing protein